MTCNDLTFSWFALGVGLSLALACDGDGFEGSTSASHFSRSDMFVADHTTDPDGPFVDDDETCEFEGETYDVGDTWPRDECNTCVCTVDGPYCTLRLCLDDDGACEHEGETYDVGDTWPRDECNLCTCTVNGPYCTFVLCTGDDE